MRLYYRTLPAACRQSLQHAATRMSRRRPSKGSSNYVFTINNPDSQLHPESWPQDKLRYVVWSLEFGSLRTDNAEGQLHYQGYLELLKRQNMHQLHRWEGLERASFQVRRGSQKQAIDYVKKQDETFLEGPWEFGVRAAQGTRQDLQDLQHDLDSGYSLSYVARNHFSNFIRYHKGINEYLRLTRPPIEEHEYEIKDFNRPALNLDKAVVLLGPTKMGKTEFALAHFSFPLFIRHADALKNIVVGEHDGLVFDDLFFGHWPPGARIALLDVAHTSEIHCRYSNGIIPRKFRRIFTTNNPDLFFNPKDTTEERDAINGRIDLIRVDRPLYGPVPDPPPYNPIVSALDRLRDDPSLINLYCSYGTLTPSPDPIPDTSYGISDLY